MSDDTITIPLTMDLSIANALKRVDRCFAARPWLAYFSSEKARLIRWRQSITTPHGIPVGGEVVEHGGYHG
jgi:hypothetical protein